MEAIMEGMDTPFLTIAQACDKTGRSASTIRRLIKGIVETADHADRDAVEPTIKAVAAYKKKGENFAWKIREDVLLREFQGALKEAKKEVTEAKGDILHILQNELSLKNQQIEKQWEVIHALNDRLREGNILMGSLQKRLGPPPSEEAQSTVVESSTPAPSTEAVSAGSKNEKRGLFGWMRR